jgi:hypothetical protein
MIFHMSLRRSFGATTKQSPFDEEMLPAGCDRQATAIITSQLDLVRSGMPCAGQPRMDGFHF